MASPQAARPRGGRGVAGRGELAAAAAPPRPPKGSKAALFFKKMANFRAKKASENVASDLRSIESRMMEKIASRAEKEAAGYLRYNMLQPYGHAGRQREERAATPPRHIQRSSRACGSPHLAWGGLAWGMHERAHHQYPNTTLPRSACTRAAPGVSWLARTQ